MTLDIDQQARLATALGFTLGKPDLFRPDFPEWLRQNFHVWLAFEREANRLWTRGRTRYSARTVIEWMRHETAVAEVGGEFKINGNFVPDLARLYECHYPKRHGFFEFRQREAA